MNIAIKKYNKSTKEGFLKGFADATIRTPWGSLDIYGISIFEKNGSRWCAFPQKMTGEKDANGKEKYFPHLRFTDRAEMDNFQSEFFPALMAFLANQATSVSASYVKQNEHNEVPF